MAINHDPNSEDFKMRVQAYIMFFRNIGIEKAAEFCVHKDATIEGLQTNNDTFVMEYHEAAEHTFAVGRAGTWLQACAHGYNGLCPVCDAVQTPPAAKA